MTRSLNDDKPLPCVALTSCRRSEFKIYLTSNELSLHFLRLRVEARVFSPLLAD